jgi:hypothetical protein
MHVELPSGATAELFTGALRSGHMRLMSRSITGASLESVGALLTDNMSGALCIAVTAWTCTGSDGKVLAVPSEDRAVLDDVDPEDYLFLANHDVVTEITKRVGALSRIAVTPDDYEDPASPTEPSDESGPVSRAEPSPPARSAARAGTKRRTTSGTPSAGAGPRPR